TLSCPLPALRAPIPGNFPPASGLSPPRTPSRLLPTAFQRQIHPLESSTPRRLSSTKTARPCVPGRLPSPHFYAGIPINRHFAYFAPFRSSEKSFTRAIAKSNIFPHYY